MSLRKTITEFQDWLVSLPLDFLLRLPFPVAIAGVFSHRGRPSQDERRSRRARANGNGHRPLFPAAS